MLKSNEEQAFLRAFEDHADALFRHTSFRIADKERARDIVQDAFLKVWDYVVGGGTVHEYRTFLYRVVHNLIVDEYRKKRSSSLDALLEDETIADKIEAQMASGSLAESEEALDWNLQLAHVAEDIERLPEVYRAVLTMRFLDGLSIQEIAQALEVSHNVIMVRIHRGIAKLKTFYE